MKKLIHVSDEIRDYISPKKYLIKKKKCCWCIVTACVVVAMLIGGIVFLALKYNKDNDLFDDFEDDFDIDDDALYAKESDFDE